MNIPLRTRYAILNFGTMIAFTAVTITVGLFTSPWLEHWLNQDRFGAFRVVLDCQGYLALLELGLGGALAPLLARAFATRDERALKQSMAAAAQAYLGVSLVTLLAGFCLTPILPRFVAGLSAVDLVDLRRAWWIGLLGLLTLSLVPFRAIIEARQRGYQVNLLLIAQSLLITAISLPLARAGWGITGQSLAFVIGTWVFTLSLTALVVKERRELLGSWMTRSEPDTRRLLWSLSAATFLINLSNRVSLMTDNLVVGSMLGAGTVTILFFTQRLPLLAQSLLLGVGSATWAPLAELHNRGERDTFNQRLIEISRLMALLSVAGLGPIVAYNRQFVSLWMGSSFSYGGDSIVILAAINAFLLPQFSLWGWCFSATGQVRRVVAVSVLAALVNVVASIAMTRWLGLIGPLLGTTFAFVAVSLWMLPVLLYRVFGTSPVALARAVGGPLLGGIVYTGGLWWITQRHQPVGRLGLAIEMSLAALGFSILCGLAILLNKNDRTLWRLRLQTVFARG
ncbi:polysaccharide biosynthesis C-terminal domain-containing protein (plasmid) [Singulisphaera sp. Ch08]|uniref:Polysaccharide biosynthesis C-terminal domain-containing protein n=1 Tax=Singulisphaera sp. Ch08 TaxID=3120278 RepID=A0AAU7CSM1_9BACT